VGILTPLGYNRSGPTRSVLGLHPERVGQDIPVGKNSAMAQTFINQFVRVLTITQKQTLELQVGYTLLRSHGEEI